MTNSLLKTYRLKAHQLHIMMMPKSRSQCQTNHFCLDRLASLSRVLFIYQVSVDFVREKQPLVASAEPEKTTNL